MPTRSRRLQNLKRLPGWDKVGHRPPCGRGCDNGNVEMVGETGGVTCACIADLSSLAVMIETASARAEVLHGMPARDKEPVSFL